MGFKNFLNDKIKNLIVENQSNGVYYLKNEQMRLYIENAYILYIYKLLLEGKHIAVMSSSIPRIYTYSGILDTLDANDIKSHNRNRIIMKNGGDVIFCSNSNIYGVAGRKVDAIILMNYTFCSSLIPELKIWAKEILAVY
jgi:hypothetical protein